MDYNNRSPVLTHIDAPRPSAGPLNSWPGTGNSGSPPAFKGFLARSVEFVGFSFFRSEMEDVYDLLGIISSIKHINYIELTEKIGDIALSKSAQWESDHCVIKYPRKKRRKNISVCH